MKRLGTVLVFKEGVERGQAEDALAMIESVLDPCWLGDNYPEDRKAKPYRLEEFDDELGGPVWYLP